MPYNFEAMTNEEIIKVIQTAAGPDKEMAMHVLYQKNRNSVLIHVERRVQHHQIPHTDCEQIVNDAFVKVFEVIDTYNPEYKFITWVSTIAYRMFLSTVEKKTREKLDFMPEQGEEAGPDAERIPGLDDIVTDHKPADNPEERAIIKQVKRAVIRTILGLKNKTHLEYIMMKFVNGDTDTEIAAHFNVTANTVRAQTCFAVKAFRSDFIKKNPDYDKMVQGLIKLLRDGWLSPDDLKGGGGTRQMNKKQEEKELTDAEIDALSGYIDLALAGKTASGAQRGGSDNENVKNLKLAIDLLSLVAADITAAPPTLGSRIQETMEKGKMEAAGLSKQLGISKFALGSLIAGQLDLKEDKYKKLKLAGKLSGFLGIPEKDVITLAAVSSAVSTGGNTRGGFSPESDRWMKQQIKRIAGAKKK